MTYTNKLTGASHDRAGSTNPNGLIISVDGEGKNLPMTPHALCDNPHVFDLIPDGQDGLESRGWHSYTMLAAADDRGHRKSIVHDGSRREAQTSHQDRDNHVARNYGLPTVNCLEFLLNLHRQPNNALIIAFYFSYDVVKILSDLPIKRLRDIASAEMPKNYHARVDYLRRRFGLSDILIKMSGADGQGLIQGESTVWGNYFISYTPRKRFHIIDLSAGRIVDPYDPKGERMTWAREVKVWDVFGFYQSSFVKALDGARTSTGDRLCPPEVIARIKGMKDQRGEFANLTDEAILNYCYEEVHYLTAMFRNTLTHIQQMELKLSRFDGSGALAGAWLKSRAIKNFKQEAYSDNGGYWGNRPGCLPESVAFASYFGGRFEVSDLGPMGDMYADDINSAYPAIMATLPCLAHGKWERVTDYVPGEWGVYLVGSLTDPDTHAEILPEGFNPRFAPFPFRPNKKLAAKWRMAEHSVVYAHGGTRWIWQNEVRVARKHYGTNAIPVHDGWVWRQECDHKPFAEIPEMFLTRRELKKNKDGAEKTYKLAYNSFYGKLAQSVGWSADNKGAQPPPFQSYIWAGMITSGTRAMILDAVCQPDADVTSIATDGILSRTPIKSLTRSKELGEWEHNRVTDAYLFQSGVYTMITHDPKCTDPETHWSTERRICKPDCPACAEPDKILSHDVAIECERKYATRGFSAKEIGYQQLIDAWNNGISTVSPAHDPNNEPTRFVPIRQGVLRLNALDVIGQWIPSVHDVELNHSRRIPMVTRDEFGLPNDRSPGDVLSSTPFVIRLEDGLQPDDLVSAPYTPKETWEDVLRELELINGSGDHLDATPDDLDQIKPQHDEEMP